MMAFWIVKTPETSSVSAPKFSVNQPQVLYESTTLRDFKAWKKQWDDYYLSTRLDGMRTREQLATLQNCLTPGMKSVLKNAIDIDFTSDMLSVDNNVPQHRNTSTRTVPHHPRSG